ncbi:hypothetical protein [Variovorax soli]|uniref:hypothetical protein n=1 Tax=Variovorax soli TaxID=376815 RepID=UPI000AE68DD6|nr:hypothetical protein [Variovorax soli]
MTLHLAQKKNAARAGNAVLDQVHSAGPYLMARLDPGRYTVEAVLAGQKIQREISIRGPARRSRASSNGRRAPTRPWPVPVPELRERRGDSNPAFETWHLSVQVVACVASTF